MFCLPLISMRAISARAVSYTHLDVYKRQGLDYPAGRADPPDIAVFKRPVDVVPCQGYPDIPLFHGDTSHVQIGHVFGIALDEFPAGFHFVPHQDGERFIGRFRIFQLNFQHGAESRIHRGFPQLLSLIHI